jgi:peptide/nickel transport system substrate-binding protein
MRKWIILFLVFLFGIVGAPSVNANRDVVTIALTGEPPTMDPHLASNAIAVMLWRWSYDTLISSETGTGKHVPWLAERWEKLGPTKVKFWLRKGVKFSDGTPLTSSAVKYSISRIVNPKNKSRQRVYFKAFDRIEIINDHTFIWHSNVADNGLFNRLTRWAHIISPKTKGMDKATISRNTFGSGPYILKTWTKGVRMVFEANPNWWAKDKYPHRPKTIVLRRMKESTTRVKALLTGEVDLIRGVSPYIIPQIEKNSNTQVAAVPAVRIFFVSFATRYGGAFANRKVRLAANYAIDASLIRKRILRGTADPFGQVFHPWNYAGYNAKKKWYGFDLQKAKALMKEAGYSKGFKAVLFTTNGRYPFDKAVCEALSGMLKKINIAATCRSVTFGVYRQLFTNYKTGKTKGPALVFRGFGNGAGDPALVARATLTCTGSWSLDCFKDLDEQVEKAAATVDTKQQQIEFEKVTDMIKERALHKLMFKIQDVFGFRKGLEFQPRHDETLYPWEIVVKRAAS